MSYYAVSEYSLDINGFLPVPKNSINSLQSRPKKAGLSSFMMVI